MAKKYQTYNPLLYVMRKQVLDGRRRKVPIFTPAAVTTFGELGPGWSHTRSDWRIPACGVFVLVHSHTCSIFSL